MAAQFSTDAKVAGQAGDDDQDDDGDDPSDDGQKWNSGLIKILTHSMCL